MKKYEKPVCRDIELRTEERIACSPGFTCPPPPPPPCLTTWVGESESNWRLKRTCYKTAGS